MKNARVIVEKSFGHDLASAQRLNAALHAVLPESRIFRIDHCLSKEAALNLLFPKVGVWGLLPQQRRLCDWSRDFGVVATIDTFVCGVLHGMFFNSVSAKPLAMSGSRSRRSVTSLSLPKSSAAGGTEAAIP